MHEPWKYIDDLLVRYPKLAAARGDLLGAYDLLRQCFEAGGKLLVAGNGGSAADSEHIAGELMKGFLKKRPLSEELRQRFAAIEPERGVAISERLQGALAVLPLTSQDALSTAFLNDVDVENIFAQKLLGYGKKGDVFLGISTSGNSMDIINAAITAKALDMQVVGLTGLTGGKLGNYCDVLVRAPESENYKIQELHLPIYHCWSMMLEEYFFGIGE